MNLQNAKYSLLAEKTILDEIKKMEAHQDKVTFIADYLRMGGINKSEQYVACRETRTPWSVPALVLSIVEASSI